ncbi:HD domain-containing protein [Pseudodesulfovibrio sp.]|uniref:HD domain-containing protein n=1 Tax=Pseudodesulfovibrio sp. TaxID=2035812 RepID=UPI00261E7AE6|nr:HD domain-containing protein [Pseudodesulfovibrio sp.]MDD3311898.1 HD domain-containing protein [Pseudodesulfovibrio sp.]
MQKTIHLYIKQTEAVDQEVRTTIGCMFPDFDFSMYAKVLREIELLFSGKKPGFEACDTPYHDWSHTLGVLLATARLLHGVHMGRQPLSERTVSLCLCAALFHDAGYIRRSDEPGPGARFTASHVQRGIDLFEDYARTGDFSMGDFMDLECMILCTDPALSPDTIVFSNLETMLAGHVLGTADILAQMSDDIYLEKLPLLFLEFSEAGITEFSSEYDLFMKTLGFYSFMRSKMRNRLSNVAASMAVHFRERHGVGRDLYAEAVDRNMEYLADLLQEYGEQYATGLRRRLDRQGHPIVLAA